MRLPVDTNVMTFLAVAAPEPVLDFETRQPKADQDGQPLYQLQVCSMADGSAQLMTVKVPGQPDVEQGVMVQPVGLVATTWERGDRHGVSFRASRIDSLNGGEKR